jgi:acyl-CoA thioesterase
MDNAAHHIVGGHIAAQVFMSGEPHRPRRRTPHSMHVYLLRTGDAREPVHFEIARLRDGGVLSPRRVLARRQTRCCAKRSCRSPHRRTASNTSSRSPMSRAPESLPSVQEQLSRYADEHGGHWVCPQPWTATRRPAGRSAGPPVAAHQVVVASHRTDARRTRPQQLPVDVRVGHHAAGDRDGGAADDAGDVFSALIDHAVWFHRPADFSDWVLSDTVAPSGVHGRALAAATMYNRTGALVCTATQEIYFGRDRR